MNKDLIIGLLVSVGVHLFALNPFAGKQPPPVREAVVKEEIIQMEMPPLGEEEDKKVEELQDEPVENVMAPPSLIDLPTVVPVNAFTLHANPERREELKDVIAHSDFIANEEVLFRRRDGRWFLHVNF